MKIMKIFICNIMIISILILNPSIHAAHEGRVDIDVHIWNNSWKEFTTRGGIDFSEFPPRVVTSGDLYKSAMAQNRNQKINEKLDEFSRNILNNQYIKLEDKLDLLRKVHEDLDAAKKYWTSENWHASSETRIKDFLQQLEKPIDEYLKQPHKSFLVDELDKNKPLTSELAINSYEKEFKMLADFLVAARKLNIDDETLKNVAKKLFRLQQFLKAKQSWSNFFASFISTPIHALIDENELKKTIRDDNFIKKVEEQSQFIIQQNLNALPEDVVKATLITYLNLKSDLSSSDERFKLFKNLASLKNHMIDDEAEKIRQSMLNDLLKNLNETINLLIAKPPLARATKEAVTYSLGEPSKQRQKTITLLTKYRDFFTKEGIESEHVQEIVASIDTILNATKKSDRILRNKIEANIALLSERIQGQEISLLSEFEAVLVADIDELDKDSDKLAYSFEADSMQDLKGQLAAWRTLIENGKNILLFSHEAAKKDKADVMALNKAAVALEEMLISLKSSLDYDVQNRFDPKLARQRNFKDRLQMMSLQAEFLTMISQKLKQWKIEINKKVYPLVDLHRIADSKLKEQKDAALLSLGLGTANEPTDLGYCIKSLSEFSWRVERRIQQLEQYVKENAKKDVPPPIKTYSKTGTGVTIKLASDLHLNLFILDDRIPLIKDRVKAMKIPYNDQQALLEYFERSNIYDANTLQDVSDLMVIQQFDLAKLNQDFTEGVFAGVVNYELELLRAPITERSERAQEAVELLTKNKLLLRGYGLEDPKMLIELNRRELALASKEYMDSAALETRNTTNLAAAKLMEEALKDAEMRSQFNWRNELGKSVTKGLVFYWKRYIIGGIAAVFAGAVGGVAGFFAGHLPGALIGAGTAGAWAYQKVQDFFDNLESSTIYKKVNEATYGLLDPAIAIGIATYSLGKAYYDARNAEPSDDEYKKWMRLLIEAQALPPQGLPPKREDELFAKFIADSTGEQQLHVIEKQKEMNFELWKFEYAKTVYCDFLNNQLQLKGKDHLTSTSSYQDIVDKSRAFNKAIQNNAKIKETEKIKLINYANASFQVMIELGRSATQKQFEYARGVHEIIAKFVFGDLHQQAMADPKKAFQTQKIEMSEEFQRMFTQDYDKMKPEERKAAAESNFINWISYYKQLFQEHIAFERYFTDHQNELLKPFGEDKPQVFTFWKDMLDGRYEMMLKMYQSTCNAIADSLEKRPFNWEELSAKAETP